MAEQLRDLYAGDGILLVEAKGATKYKGVLASVEGPFGNTEGQNRNGRVYTNGFWDHVLTQRGNEARLKERAVVGELEHPTTLHSGLGHISHVITEVKVQPDEKRIWGRADILDTPSGRILHTLFQAGVKVGISSRGAGSLDEKDDGSKYVKQEDYVWGGFDFVADPSAPNAYPRLSEGQVSVLVEALGGHLKRMEDDPDFYENMLRPLGASLDIVRERTKNLNPVDVSAATSEAEGSSSLGKAQTTIVALQSKMEQMVEGHKELSLKCNSLEEKLREKEDISIRSDTLSDLCLTLRAKCLKTAEDLNTLKPALREAREKVERYEQFGIEGLKEALEKEQNLRQQIDETEKRLEVTLTETTERATALSLRIEKHVNSATEKKVKLENYRRELLESMSDVFGCDMRSLTDGLQPGFSPKEVIERAFRSSTKLKTESLPLKGGIQLMGIKDVTGVTVKETHEREGLKNLIRGVRGSKG